MPLKRETPTYRSACCVLVGSLSYTRSADPLRVVMVMCVGKRAVHVPPQASKPTVGPKTRSVKVRRDLLAKDLHRTSQTTLRTPDCNHGGW